MLAETPKDATQTQAWDRVAPSVNFTIVPDMGNIIHFIPDRTARILDYGCGYGRVGALLAQKGYTNTIGYDTSQGLIERGRKIHPVLTLSTYTFPSLPEESGSFDAVIACAVMTCMPEPETRETAMREILRVLKVGGLLYLAEFLRDPNKAYDSHSTFTSSQGIVMKHFTKEELTTLPPSLTPLLCHETKESSLSGAGLSAFHQFIRKN